MQTSVNPLLTSLDGSTERNIKVSPHIETSQLIYSVNQLADFHVSGTLVFNALIYISFRFL